MLRQMRSRLRQGAPGGRYGVWLRLCAGLLLAIALGAELKADPKFHHYLSPSLPMPPNHGHHAKGQGQPGEPPPGPGAKGHQPHHWAGFPHGAHEKDLHEGSIPSPPPAPSAKGPKPPPTPTAPLGPPPGDPPTPPTANVAEAVAAIAAAAAATGGPSTGAPPTELMRVGGPVPAADGKKGMEGQPRLAAPGAGRIADLAPTLGTFSSDQILGHHLRPDVVTQLMSSAYKVESGHSGSVTRLTLPDYLSALEELPKLQARFPDQLFGLNFLYRSYRSAGESGLPQDVPHGSGGGGGCDAARCYGPNLIGWRPELAACARSVVIGIIDTGLDQRHSAVKRLQLIQHPADASRRGSNWHGTGVAALLAGARESSTPGLIPDAQFVVVDAFFSSAQEGSTGQAKIKETVTDTDHLVWALEVLAEKRAQIVNMSLVGPSDPAIHAVIRKMSRNGVVFIAAAGNGGPAGGEAFPAAYLEVIAVTAVDRNKRSYAEANHGAYIDVAAPGVRVWTALPEERQGFLSGTSFAVPFVTAIAAVTYNSTPMKSASADRRGTLNPKDEVLGRLAIEKLGGGEVGMRDRVFGLGLAQAPLSCSPPRSERILAAERGKDPEPKPDREWQAQVHRTSSAQ